jgi:hypothetical protein
MNTGRQAWFLALDPAQSDTVWPDLMGLYNSTLASPSSFEATTRTGGLAQLDNPRGFGTKPPGTTGLLTVAAWVKFTGTPTENSAIVNANTSWILRFGANRTVTFYFWSGGVLKQGNSTTQLAADVWNRVVATYNGGTSRIYFNGVLTSTGAVTHSGTIDNTQANMGIGRNIGGVELFTGSIDSVSIWNRALTQADVTAELAEENAGLANYIEFTDAPAGFASRAFQCGLIRGLPC